MNEPRALVALSEDRQWLVVLDPEPEPYAWDGGEESVYWSVYRWDHDDMLYVFSGDETPNATNSGGLKDTGQDAHEVLAQWLEGLSKPIGCQSESLCDGSCQHCEDLMYDRLYE